MQPSIIIADDHPLILKGLKDFLTEKNFNVTDSANDGKEALKLILKHDPDIAILDIKMPFMSGLEIAEACKMNGVKTKIVLITFEKDGNLLKRAKEINVHGYILKEFALSEIENCLKALDNGESYFSPDLMEYVSTENILDLNILSVTEKKILKLVCQNMTTKDIGEKLFISYRTVEKHRSNIIRKLNLDHHQNSLLIWAKENQKYLL
ncbi:MAG: response regulator transcription factor [Flavobacteriaceae bacterium]|nr:response regulator transcription factor [Flavobacteriaceae bacterium]